MQYSQIHSAINHCDRCITLLSDTDISFVLFNLFISFDMPSGDSKQHSKGKRNFEDILIEQKMYPNHQDE